MTRTRLTAQSEAAFARARRHLPGGVNSPVRAFRAVGGTPLFATHGEVTIRVRSRWQPLHRLLALVGASSILGHAAPNVIQAVTEAAARGTSFGMPTELESDMAELVAQLVPSIEMVRMVNSGTEATMSALRLARAYTGRPLIVKFEGCYHGHADHLLVKAGSGVATFGLPDSPGVPASVAGNTLTAAYNDLSAVQALFERRGEEIAAVIVEPVAGNMGMVLPEPGFLEGLRTLTEQYGALLIFDEVMTGFRISLGGAQQHFGIQPDLTTLGKVIGGGLPVGAYGGRREIMEQVAPSGSVYQAGTLSGNPLAMAAGFTTLQTLQRLAREEQLYERLDAYGAALAKTFETAAAAKGIPVVTHHLGTMFGLFFSEQPVRDYASASMVDRDRYAKFFHGLLDEGVALAPSGLESGFLASVHTDETLAATQAAIEQVMQRL